MEEVSGTTNQVTDEITFTKYLSPEGEIKWEVEYSDGVNIYEAVGILSMELERQKYLILMESSESEG